VRVRKNQGGPNVGGMIRAANQAEQGKNVSMLHTYMLKPNTRLGMGASLRGAAQRGSRMQSAQLQRAGAPPATAQQH
jgi:hypothetical protein